jgi:hypothetical protein
MVKSKPFHGPRLAQWSVTYPRPSICSSTYGKRDTAMSDFARAEVATGTTLERRELCVHPGCDGYGQIFTRKRGSPCGTHRDCPQCAGHQAETILEAVKE